MVGLENGHIRKASNPRDIVGNAEEEKEEFDGSGNLTVVGADRGGR